MPAEPTREELLAQIASLQAQLARTTTQPPQFVQEVPGVAPPNQPAKKTSQVPTQQPVVDAHKAALARALDPHRRLSKQTPQEITDQITALTTVISSGVNSAGYGDKRTEFRSLTELRQILNGLEEDLADALGMGGRVRQIRMTTQADKGL
jgi:hypothetical protein